jgi:predicted nucleic acid-binding protein
MIVADTDVLIDFLRGRGEAERVRVELESRDFGTTAVTAFELWAVARHPREIAAVESLLAALTVLPLDTPSARRAAEVRRSLDAEGAGIGMADSLVAGICLENRAILLTRNKRHFARVPDLLLSGFWNTESPGAL